MLMTIAENPCGEVRSLLPSPDTAFIVALDDNGDDDYDDDDDDDDDAIGV